MWQTPSFFWLHLNLEAKFQTEIELLSLIKLRKNILSLGICLIKKKIYAYASITYQNMKWQAKTHSKRWHQQM